MSEVRGAWSRAVAVLVIAASLSHVLALNTKHFTQQRPFGESDGGEIKEQQPLYGRFLHFTDMHPDQYYSPGSSINDACHTPVDESNEFTQTGDLKSKKHRKKERNRVGHWGAPVSVCDSPKHLIEATLDWLSENWMPSSSDQANSAKGIDFIIWTGDTARHDIDATHPRNAQEIFEYNRWALDLVESRFPGVSIIPNLGNNDIIPHNIMFPGPNSMTKAYADIWQKHIPASEQETARQGGYFAKEVIKSDLAVLSLNTLYWYDTNAAVRGCKGKSDPGTLQLDWMEETLTEYRNRSMQVHLIGHVPPTAGNFFENCFERYTDMALRYQDTIVGQHFGHMNIDGWYLQRNIVSKKDEQTQSSELVNYVQPNSNDYLAFFVSPSVVPTYLPSVRVWTYNVSKPSIEQVAPQSSALYINDHSGLPLNESDQLRIPSISTRKHRNLPRYISPDSPSRKNSYLTPLGYSQWVLDLEKANRRYRKESKKGLPHSAINYQLEYTTYKASTLWSQYLGADTTDTNHVPVPKTLLDRELKRLNARSPTPFSFWRRLRLPRNMKKEMDVRVPKKVRHLTRYGLSSCTVDELLEWAHKMVSCKSLLSSKTRNKYNREGYCRMKGGGYQYRNSDVE